jgi:DNA polymerase-1
VPLAHEGDANLERERVLGWLGPALADPAVAKVGEDLKRDTHLMSGWGAAMAGLAFDLRIGSFLCDPSRAHSLDALARDFLARELPALDPAPRSLRTRGGAAALPVAQAAAALEARVATMLPLADALRAQLEARDQWSLYERLEHPLIPVLIDMERAGIAIDAGRLIGMGTRAGEEIERLRGELLAMAGEPLNLDSGPQVAKVLFERLGLKPGGRTPSGALSTRSEVLEELAGLHPFPARLLEYRALTKLKSTYFDTLPRAADPRDGRVHTSYDQTGAATGRLSSSNPNLQNIPMRTEQGREIRRAFGAAPGSLLIGADYSQIELRVMAHLSGDDLIAAFAAGEDVRTRGASSRGRRAARAAFARQDRQLRHHVRHGRAQPVAADGHRAARGAGLHRRLLQGVRARARVPGRDRRGGARARLRPDPARPPPLPAVALEPTGRHARGSRARRDQRAHPGLGGGSHEAGDDPRPPRLEAALALG